MASTFIPADFAPPSGFDDEPFHAIPLGPERNEADYEAWTSSIEHIRETPGFVGRSWPRPMTLEENRDDLARHAADFALRTGFTYTVLDRVHGSVIGCVYIYPGLDDGHDAHVRSWVRATRGDLDSVLYRAVIRWLAREWPFERIDYAPRATPAK
jgi:hypothetical protein